MNANISIQYLLLFPGSRSPVRTPPASFYPPLHSMWGFTAHGTPSSPSNGPAHNGSGTPSSSKDPVSGFPYPPTPPIDLKSGTTSDNQHQHLQLASQPHQDYLQQPQNPDLTSDSVASVTSGLPLPSLASIEAKHSDHLMSSLGFPSYSTSASASVASVASATRKFHEGKE